MPSDPPSVPDHGAPGSLLREPSFLRLWLAGATLMAMGDIAGLERVGRAMGLDLTANNAIRIIGLALGGFVLQTIGIAGIYTVSTVSYAFCTLLVLGVVPPRPKVSCPRSSKGCATCGAKEPSSAP